MALELAVKHLKEIPILQITGRIVDIDVKKFAKKLELLSKTTAQIIVIDLSFVSFIDSHGLGVIVFHHSTLAKSKRKLLILNSNTDPTTYVNRLFEMTHLNAVMNVVSVLDSASLTLK